MCQGLLLSAAIAGLCVWLTRLPILQQWGLSALTLAIITGMALGNTVFGRMAPHVAAGVDFSRTRLLRLGIILYGFRITFAHLVQVGWLGLVIDLVMMAGTFVLAVWVGTRLLHMDEDLTMLIGAGASVCGAAAVMGAEPVVRAPSHKVSIAVATVVVFGTLAMFLYPLMYPVLGMSDYAYGLYVGSTVHEVAQVVVAGDAVSAHAARIAVIEKMLRVMLLAPFLLMLGAWLARRRAGTHGGRNQIAIPWFVLGFVAVSGFNSLQWLPARVVDGLLVLDTFILAMAMGALGLRTQFGAIRQAGVQPLLLAAVLAVFLIGGGYVVNTTLVRLMG